MADTPMNGAPGPVIGQIHLLIDKTTASDGKSVDTRRNWKKAIDSSDKFIPSDAPSNAFFHHRPIQSAAPGTRQRQTNSKAKLKPSGRRWRSRRMGREGEGEYVPAFNQSVTMYVSV